MRRFLLTLIASLILLKNPSAVRGADTDALTGKWSVKKASNDGEKYTQNIEIKKDKFIFEILGDNDRVVIHSEGDLKLEKIGPFSAVRLFHIRAGDSASNLNEIDDEYVSIYILDNDTWTTASNFDKERGQKASLDVYHRVKTVAEPKTLIIDEIQMTDTPQSATWYLCFEAKVEGVSRRHYLENKGYDRSKVAIPVGLEIGTVKPGQKCSFKLQLDDVDGDACSNEADNSSTGEFAASETGAQTYRPEDHWAYTIRWHLR